ncbi:MAG: metallopeptidase TldD-related protein [Myxococcota bacterium]
MNRTTKLATALVLALGMSTAGQATAAPEQSPASPSPEVASPEAEASSAATEAPAAPELTEEEWKKARLDEVEAVRAELVRGVEGLSLPDTPAPHRAQARWVRAELLSLDGSYGGVITNVLQQQAAGIVELRVGTPERDDSNFFGSDAGITRLDVPVDPDPRYLRKQVWLALDRAFRGATVAYSQKEVALEQLSTETTLPDLGPAPAPVDDHRLFRGDDVDRAGFATLVADLSGRFEQAPTIDNGDVHFQVLRSHETVVTSDGVVVVRTRERSVLAVVADTQAPDGMPLDHGLALHFEGVPAIDDALRAKGEALVDQVLRELQEQVDAPMIEEEYDGPILLVGAAPAQFLASTVATEASGYPAPLADGGRVMDLEPAWQNKVGKTVLPPYLDLVDDPTQPKGFGDFAIDIEGFVPGPVTLVEAGVLRDLLLTRVPNPHHGTQSNGRARMTPSLEIGPALSNLRLRSRKRGLNPTGLQRELLRRAREDGYDFAYVVEALRDGTVLGSVMRSSAAAYAGTGKLDLPLPARVFRVDASGKRTLVRGAILAPASIRALRRIRAVGQPEHTERLRLPVGSFGGFASDVGMDGILSQTVDVQVTSPPLIIDGLELLMERGEYERLPTLPHPLRREAAAEGAEHAEPTESSPDAPATDDAS